MSFAVLLTILKRNFTKEISVLIEDIRIENPIAVLKEKLKDLIDLYERKGIVLGKLRSLL